MTMKKLINRPDDLVNDALLGYAMANKNIIELVPNSHMIVRKNRKEKGKVKFVLGNGAGHEPAVIGWVGPGMLDMNVVGEVFSAPSSDKILEALEYIDDGRPILLAVQNHAGDVLNANLAYTDALEKGIDVHKVLFYDDVASAPKGMEEERRGMGGMLFYTKIVGAFLEKGGSIDEAVSLFEKVRDATRTYSVAFTKCTHPLTGLDISSLPEDEIELGMGVHGEGGGANRIPMQKSKDLARIVCDILIEDLPYKPEDDVLLFINGLGSTTMMELSLFYKDAAEYLESKKIHVYDGFCGSCLTTQELGGLSVSLCKVDDDCKTLWDAPCCCGIQCKL